MPGQPSRQPRSHKFGTVILIARNRDMEKSIVRNACRNFVESRVRNAQKYQKSLAIIFSKVDFLHRSSSSVALGRGGKGILFVVERIFQGRGTFHRLGVIAAIDLQSTSILRIKYEVFPRLANGSHG